MNKIVYLLIIIVLFVGLYKMKESFDNSPYPYRFNPSDDKYYDFKPYINNNMLIYPNLVSLKATYAYDGLKQLHPNYEIIKMDKDIAINGLPRKQMIIIKYDKNTGIVMEPPRVY